MIEPPKIDERNSRDLVEQLRKLLPRYTPAFPRTAEEKQLSEAMIHVFARFGEILIDRINRAPEKNFLAFLDTIGVSNLPARAAQVPLTFYLASEAAEFAVIREGTQVAAQQLKGEKVPVIFETTRELVVVSSRLTSLFTKDGAHDRYSDFTRLLPQSAPKPNAALAEPAPAVPLFGGSHRIPHCLYIGFRVASPASSIDTLRLRIKLREKTPASPLSIQWALCVPPTPKPGSPPAAPHAALPLEDLFATGTLLTPTTDTTAGLSKSGDVVFEKVPALAPPAAQGEQQYWIGCRLLTPIVSDAAFGKPNPAAPMVAPSALPEIESMRALIEIDRSGLLVGQAFSNGNKLDLTKDFFPFGERPKFGDTLYLRSAELFSSQDARVTLRVDLTNPVGATGELPIPPVTPQKVKLAWEFWDGEVWRAFGFSADAPRVRILSAEGAVGQPDPFRDTTTAFSTNGDVLLTFTAPPAPTSVNGQSDFWIRVRIVSGNYGHDAYRHKDLIGSTTVQANFAPPVIRSIKAEYSVRRELPPHALVAYDDFSYHTLDPDTVIQPFQPVTEDDAVPAIYFGFELPRSKTRTQPADIAAAATAFPSRSMCIYFDVEQSAGGLSTEDAASAQQAIAWEYWNGADWVSWTVRDETGGFRHPGIVRFLAPADFKASSRFACTRYWLRAIPTVLDYQPMIRGAYLNTVMAAGNITVHNELLGVSNGMPDQSFPLLHKPVLEGQQLEILEPRMPGRVEQEAIQDEENGDAIRPGATPSNPTAVWIRWHQVADFYASGPRDRHYVLNSLTGVVLFGDGANGHIPPRGGSIRMSQYRYGGGAATNRPAWNISQIKTAVPYIGSATNWIASGGGGDAEDTPSLLHRGSRGLRHNHRAVTLQDYEDLAYLASPEVAFARCVPSLDLAAEPLGKHRRPGVVSVIVVPRSDDPRPLPGSQLLGCVLGYLKNSAPPAAQISVVAPEYLPIDVAADVVIEESANDTELELAIKLALAAFLHPLTGGPNSVGWDFGRMPPRSDFYLQLEALPGVRYVRDVRIVPVPPREGLERAGRFLVCAGNFTVTLSLDAGSNVTPEAAACR